MHQRLVTASTLFVVTQRTAVPGSGDLSDVWTISGTCLSYDAIIAMLSFAITEVGGSERPGTMRGGCCAHQ